MKEFLCVKIWSQGVEDAIIMANYNLNNIHYSYDNIMVD
jgi:hypothetical protein